MEHRSINGRDLPSTHRLPTVSAAQAQEVLSGDTLRFVSTGLKALDTLLADRDGGLDHDLGGVQRGLVTEIWGPPGAGKTTLGLHLASSVLANGRSVVWVDGFHIVCPERLTAVTSAECGTESLAKFSHFDASLVVIDSLTSLVNHWIPKAADAGRKGNDKVPSPAARRQQTLQYVIGALQKLAAARDLAVVLLSQCATNMQMQRGGATLIPAVNTSSWDDGISTRIALFRHWSMQGGSARAARFAAVLKLDGRKVDEGDLQLVAFDITATGAIAANLDGCDAQRTTAARKRKPGGDGAEIPDSDEEYGWDDDDYDDDWPLMPSQWQGSEDILLGQLPESEDQFDPDADEEEPTPSGPEV